jgi:hypothetical protein
VETDVVSRRTNPVDQVVAFFETAPLEQAATVLAIAKGILARRQPKTKTAKPPRKDALVDGADGGAATSRPRA